MVVKGLKAMDMCHLILITTLEVEVEVSLSQELTVLQFLEAQMQVRQPTLDLLRTLADPLTVKKIMKKCNKKYLVKIKSQLTIKAFFHSFLIFRVN